MPLTFSLPFDIPIPPYSEVRSVLGDSLNANHRYDFSKMTDETQLLRKFCFRPEFKDKRLMEGGGRGTGLRKYLLCLSLCIRPGHLAPFRQCIGHISIEDTRSAVPSLI